MKAGWMGRNKNTSDTEYNSQPRPLASLRDPKSFGQPPRHRDTVASPSGVSGSSHSYPSGTEDAPSHDSSSRRQEIPSEEQEERKPTGPFVVDTTGLDTSRFPKPPVRSVANDPSSPVTGAPPAGGPMNHAKPSLPPRLPPRQSGGPTEAAEQNISQDAHTYSSAKPAGNLNRSAIDRLGKSGVSVPGFGIGSSTTNSAPKELPSGLNGSELQTKFSRMNVSDPNQSPTLNDSSVWSTSGKGSPSIADVRDTAITAKNIHEKHGNQINQGLNTLNSINQKHDIANKLNRAPSADSNTQALGARFGSIVPTKDFGQGHNTGSQKSPPPPVPSKAALMSKISRPPP